MELQIFAVWDQAIEGYMNPFFLQTKGQAIRGFADAVNEDGHQMNRHPEDYTLFHLGTWNPKSGRFEEFIAHDRVGTALEFLNIGEVGERMRIVGDPSDG